MRASAPPPLREAVAAHGALARGVRCEPGQVIVVEGAQQALEFALRLLTDPGDVVANEDLEDDYNSEFRYAALPVPSLQSLDPGGRVVCAGSFTKILFPALRVGYLVVPTACSRR